MSHSAPSATAGGLIVTSAFTVRPGPDCAFSSATCAVTPSLAGLYRENPTARAITTAPSTAATRSGLPVARGWTLRREPIQAPTWLQHLPHEA